MRSLIIGLGTAGVHALNALYEMVDENNENIKFYAIESSLNSSGGNEANIYRKESDNYTFFQLNKEGRWIPKELETFPFLRKDLKLEGEGATRNRIIGRYLLDNIGHLESMPLFKNLTTEIYEFLNDDQANKANVWILNSLSGGTGSGAYPLIAMWIRNKYEEIKQTNSDFELNICGVGFYSHTYDFVFPNKKHMKYYSNSFAAMRELNKILWPDVTKTKNIKCVSLYGAEDSDISIELKKDGAFDKYFLVPMDESKVNDVSNETEKYASKQDKIVANCIYNIIVTDENSDVMLDKSKLGKFYEQEIGFDVETFEKYIKNKQQINEIISDIKILQSDLNEEKIIDKAWKYYQKKDKRSGDYSNQEKLNILQSFFANLFEKETQSDKKSLFSKKNKFEKYHSDITDLLSIYAKKDKINEFEIICKKLFKILTTKSSINLSTKRRRINIPFCNDKLKNILNDTEIINKPSLKSLIDGGYIDETLFKDIYEKQFKDLERSFQIELTSKFNIDKDGNQTSTISYRLYNKVNAELLSRLNIIKNTTGMDVPNSIDVLDDPNTIKIIIYHLGYNLKALPFYTTMQMKYRTGALSKKDRRFEDEGGIGSVCAYPEFFLNDPRVMNAYREYIDSDVELDFDRYWHDCPDDIKSELLAKQGSNEDEI